MKRDIDCTQKHMIEKASLKMYSTIGLCFALLEESCYFMLLKHPGELSQHLSMHCLETDRLNAP